jgi:hypothetical protein
MSGEVIRHWKVRMLDWVRPNQILDEEATWDQFLVQFQAEYADTQRADRAREAMDRFQMKGSAVDQYISDFIRLAEDAGYDLDAPGTWRFFIKGLPKFVGVEVIKAAPQNWADLRLATVNATNAWQRINLTFGPWIQNASNSNQRKGSNNANWRQNTQSTQGQRPPYNSSNAPRSYNNTNVPMDLSTGRSSRRPGPTRGNVAQTQGTDRPKIKCFNCDIEGHIARNCRKPKRARIAETETNDLFSEAGEETVVDYSPTGGDGSPQDIAKAFRAMTTDQQQQFADEVGVGGSQDFPAV